MASDDEAQRLAEKAVELLRELGDAADEEGVEEVRRRTKDVSRLLTQGPAIEALSTAIGALGVLLQHAGDKAAVTARLQEFLWLAKDAAAVAKQAEDRRGTAIALQALARTHLCRSEPDAPIAAQRAAKEVIAIFQELGDSQMEAEALSMAADAHLMKADKTPFEDVRNKEVSASVERSKAAMEIYRKLGDRKGMAIATHSCAQALLRSTDEDAVGEGERLADDARDAFYELGEKKLEVQATMTAITYRRATVGDESALMVAQDSVGDWQLENRQLDAADALIQAAELQVQLEEYDDVVTSCKDAKALYDKAGKTQGAANALQIAAKGLGKTKKLDEATRSYDEAASLLLKLGDRRGEGGVWAQAAELVIDRLVEDVDAETRAIHDRQEPPVGMTTEDVYARIAVGMGYADKAIKCYEAVGDKALAEEVQSVIQHAYDRAVKLYCDTNEPDQILTKLKPDSPMEDESTLEWKIALPYIKRPPEEAKTPEELNGYVLVKEKRNVFKSKLPLEKAEKRLIKMH